MGSPSTPEDLLDLKLLPSWVNEPPPVHKYADFEGEDDRRFERRDHGPGRSPEKSGRGPRSRDARPPQSRERSGPGERSGEQRPGGRPGDRRDQRPRRPGGQDRRPLPNRERNTRGEQRESIVPPPPVPVTIRFLPHPPPLEGVVAQIKSGSVAYSVFALA